MLKSPLPPIEPGALRRSPPPLALLDDGSLLLDFDGTLVEIAARPDAVFVDDSLRELLRRLRSRLDGRLALVSGRSIDDLRHLFGSLPFTVAGSHGIEIETADGHLIAPRRVGDLAPVMAKITQLQAAHPGIVVERKPYGIAVHYRLAPQAEVAVHALFAALADNSGLMLQPGKMMCELRLAGADKGDAIRALMAAPGMAGTLPVFIGDDDTDEAGFVAVAALGGAGVLVGSDRPSAAAYRLENVAATLAWLRGAVA